MRILITGRSVASNIVECGRPKIDGLISLGSRKEDLIPFGIMLQFSDICKDWQDHLAPTEDQVLEAVAYAHKLENEKHLGTLLIHCAAGQSRSTGIALAYHCSKGLTPAQAFTALRQDIEGTWVARLRNSPSDYYPNGRIVMHADKLYGYEGKLIDEYCARFVAHKSLEDVRTSFWQSVTVSEDEDPLALPLWTLP